ncbi:MAG TPA: hypothetical protein VMZ91_06645 [Candidatus Paceibacterota bacterium]|nr:hypothetical protein [Candidatus Paceibacterota bacterium]
MNDFCKRCNHKHIPDLLKEKFNELIKKTFIECPTEDKKIVFCFINKIDIEWENFFKYILAEGLLQEDELSRLEKEGWKLTDRKGGIPPS